VRGGLLVAETPEEVDQPHRKAVLERAAGLETEVISGREARDLAPELAPDLLAADYLPDEGFGNPLLVAPAFARKAIDRGARFHLHCPVIGLERRHGGGFRIRTPQGTFEAGRVVDAAGAWAGEIAALLGIQIPIEGHVITVNVTEPVPFTLKQMVQHIGRRLTLKQSQYGTFIIGGGWPGDFVPDRQLKQTRFESSIGNLYNAARVVPLLRDVRFLRSWGGMSGTTPGYAPILGEWPGEPGFFVLTGGAGFTLGPLNGRLMAELLVTGHTSVSTKLFDPAVVVQPAH
jgi:sarcosine oxidase, subunit beta